MDRFYDILLALLPALVVFLTAYYMIRQFLGGQARQAHGQASKELALENRKHALPLRLQAHERLALFLERIAPGPMVLRVHRAGMSAGALHRALLTTVREEFDHNITQQIYVSERVWGQVRNAKEETIRLINMAYEQSGGDQAAGTAMSQKVFELAGRLSHTPSEQAVLVLREEVRRFF